MNHGSSDSVREKMLDTEQVGKIEPHRFRLKANEEQKEPLKYRKPDDNEILIQNASNNNKEIGGNVG